MKKTILILITTLTVFWACQSPENDPRRVEEYWKKNLMTADRLAGKIQRLNYDFPRLLDLRLHDSLTMHELLKVDSALTADKYDFFRLLDSLRKLNCCNDKSLNPLVQHQLIGMSTILEREHKTLYLTLQMSVNRKNMVALGNNYLSAIERLHACRDSIRRAGNLFRKKYNLKPVDYTIFRESEKKEYQKAKTWFDGVLSRYDAQQDRQIKDSTGQAN